MRRLVYIFFALILVTLFTIWFANRLIVKSAEGRTYTEPSKLPHSKAGLLLGTSKINRVGGMNLYFSNRIKAALELLQAHKIDYLVISGDNSRVGYDEPSDMRAELLKGGADSTKIFLDYAGFRTFDSMVRLKEIFGQDSVTIISQKFHNERAIYIANRIGITAYGYNAADVNKYYGFKTSVREKFARVKVVLDFIFGAEPKFLGEKIEIK